MNLDGTITVGDLITAASIAVGGIGVAYTMVFKLAALEDGQKKTDGRIDGLETELKKQTEILVQLAEQRGRIASVEAQYRERMIAIDKRMDDLSARMNN